MQRILLTSFMIVLLSTASAFAALSEQVQTALSKKDYMQVQELVSQDNKMGGEVETHLLNSIKDKVGADGTQATEVMALAANISPYITSEYVIKIDEALKKIVNNILELKPKSPEQSDQFLSIFNAALTISKSRIVREENPDLATWTEAKLEGYSSENDILLAQLPNGNYYPQGVGTRFIPTPPAFTPSPTTSGSPSE